MGPVIWILASVLLSVAAQIFLKLGTRQTGPISIGANGPRWVSVLGQRHILAWGVLNVFALVFYLRGLSQVDLSYAYPFIALNYALIPLISIRLFRERVRPRQWLGIAVICAGVLLITFR